MAKLVFPDNFVWGAATASYQIEGAVDVDGRLPSIWDTYSAISGNTLNGDTGAVACDHYHRYPQDIQLMKEQLGIKAYRFSIAWPRIIPTGTGAVNPKGLDFYDRLVDSLLEAGITPYATLYHWDLPQTLEDQGGWPWRGIVDAYVNYADVVSKHLGDRVKHWMTFNEPWVFTFVGYTVGRHAPGRTSWQDYLAGIHHFLLAHAGAVPVIRENCENADVGVVVNLAWADPATDSADDVAAAGRQMSFQNRWLLDPMYFGEYPSDLLEIYGEAGLLPDIQAGDLAKIHRDGKPDFLGINFYFREVLKYQAGDNILNTAHVSQVGKREHTKMGWEVSPEGIYNILKWTHNAYKVDRLFITENGAAFDDEVTVDADGTKHVHDARRVAYYQAYIAEVHRAIQDGVPLEGYFAWSLLDNFEWGYGYDRRFGIIRVDYDTQERIVKDSGKWYSQVVRNNGFEVE